MSTSPSTSSPAHSTAEEKLPGIENFLGLRSAARHLVWIILGMLALAGGFLCFAAREQFLDENGLLVNRVVFVFYACCFFGTWATYFLSGTVPLFAVRNPHIKVRTLRRLLRETVVHASVRDDDTEAAKTMESMRGKATTSIQVLSVLMAVATLLLSTLAGIYAEATRAKLELVGWQKWTLLFSAAFAVISFVSFLISVDALDTMFNRFKSPAEEKHLVHYFYWITLDPKYMGLASLMLSVVFLVQYYSPTFASFTVALTLVIGRRLWFPLPDMMPEAPATLVRKQDAGGQGLHSGDRIVLTLAFLFAAPVLTWIAKFVRG